MERDEDRERGGERKEKCASRNFKENERPRKHCLLQKKNEIASTISEERTIREKTLSLRTQKQKSAWHRKAFVVVGTLMRKYRVKYKCRRKKYY